MIGLGTGIMSNSALMDAEGLLLRNRSVGSMFRFSIQSQRLAMSAASNFRSRKPVEGQRFIAARNVFWSSETMRDVRNGKGQEKSEDVLFVASYSFQQNMPRHPISTARVNATLSRSIKSMDTRRKEKPKISLLSTILDHSLQKEMVECVRCVVPPKIQKSITSTGMV